MSRSPYFVGFYLILGGAVLAGLLVAGSYASGLLSSASNDPSPVVFEVPTGSTVRQVSEALVEANLITNDWAFRTYIRLNNYDQSIQAGTFSIPGNLNAREVAQLLVGGSDGQPERTITLIEGWAAADYATYLAQQGVLSEEDFMNTMSRLQDQLDSPVLEDKPGGVSLEGYLFPDSYRIFEGASAEEIILKLLHNFEQKLNDELRAEIARTNRSVFDVVIMASIVEREAGTTGDKQVIAGVFYNRLREGIALQSDATLNYVLPADERTPRLSLAQTQDPSPYNTYQHRGLPPGPIGNPGLEAIEAAVYPASHDYFYFLTDSAGNAHYARTLSEHIENRQLYLD